MNSKKVLAGAALALILMTSPFLAQAGVKTQSDEKAVTATTQVVKADDMAADTATEAVASTGSEGMRIPVDGSSLEAFDKSLAEIKKKTTAKEYTSLTGAIEYLLVYDLAARKNKTKLAANLDGLTADEIIARVNWGGKSRKNR